MKFKRYRFDKKAQADFARTLTERAQAYFKDNNLSYYGESKFIPKTIFMFSLLFVPLGLMLTGVVTSVPVMFGLWILMGFGMTGIGTGVMHDAVHGTYSKNKRINKLVGMSMNVIGGNDFVWHIQHNVLHHSFTNIANADDDIQTPGILRFSPHIKRQWFHKFQHIYVWFFYSIATIFWITTKDFMQLRSYYKREIVKEKSVYQKELVKMAIWKVVYYLIFLVSPLYLIEGASAGLIVVMFLVMHMVMGASLSAIFQPAHVNPETGFYDEPDHKIGHNQMVHQLFTTSNFAMKNKALTWFVGGLNYQVEHHLFPYVCHLHYGPLSKIVQETAEEFGMPYYQQESFFTMLFQHLKMLRKLGTQDVVDNPNEEFVRQKEAAMGGDMSGAIPA